ncbi:hypothetical protein SAMN02949497_4238 [Methylomagnum ishizawai]|uniref:Uncharacterized protein n=1 Tax=Methylomagnum ishizawai TaxID=1760988 RepID=A0A1Y6D2F8_9GAMM|nr:hypothetical protein [Methylomagnum ishizawai]SMF96827.1 hypothetical protein SAMN02949497_4238 [Methylomagnum ishizawai]
MSKKTQDSPDDTSRPEIILGILANAAMPLTRTEIWERAPKSAFDTERSYGSGQVSAVLSRLQAGGRVVGETEPGDGIKRWRLAESAPSVAEPEATPFDEPATESETFLEQQPAAAVDHDEAEASPTHFPSHLIEEDEDIGAFVDVPDATAPQPAGCLAEFSPAPIAAPANPDPLGDSDWLSPVRRLRLRLNPMPVTDLARKGELLLELADVLEGVLPSGHIDLLASIRADLHRFANLGA